MADLSDAVSAASLTDDQLHARACHRGPYGCAGPLAPAGHVYTAPAEPGAPLGWPVVACDRHREEA
ncbi:hypothetical protein [Kitasatospora sp. NPDC059571]|uniref:hypothetical protein n=1 Tax=Kitasatospora sp. NPDC059571 TaxID=3346871 RepID=UPI0036CCD9DB